MGVAEVVAGDLFEGAGEAECFFRSTISPLLGFRMTIPALFFVGIWKLPPLGLGAELALEAFPGAEGAPPASAGAGPEV